MSGTTVNNTPAFDRRSSLRSTLGAGGHALLGRSAPLHASIWDRNDPHPRATEVLVIANDEGDRSSEAARKPWRPPADTPTKTRHGTDARGAKQAFVDGASCRKSF